MAAQLPHSPCIAPEPKGLGVAQGRTALLTITYAAIIAGTLELEAEGSEALCHRNDRETERQCPFTKAGANTSKSPHFCAREPLEVVFCWVFLGRYGRAIRDYAGLCGAMWGYTEPYGLLRMAGLGLLRHFQDVRFWLLVSGLHLSHFGL